MRPDFSKVVTERPRRRGLTYGENVRAAYKRIGDDDAGYKEGMRAPHMRHGAWKEFDDLLGPLVRFLHSRVGRKWDDVYSEICANLKGRNTTQQHILDHLDHMVTTKLRVAADGTLIEPCGRRWYYYDFYADPRDGRLKRAAPRKFQSRNPPPVTEFVADDGSAYAKRDGIWYAVSTVEQSVPMFLPTPGQEVRYVTIRTERKRQLATRELRALDLTNGPE